MKKPNGLNTGISEPEKVVVFFETLDHPLKELAQVIRTSIFETHPEIGEGIYWNVPTFYFTGKMPEFDPKEYRRYIVNYNFLQKDCIRMIFLRGADVKNTTGLLEGDYKDGRRIAYFRSMEDFQSKEADLKSAIQQLIEGMK